MNSYMTPKIDIINILEKNFNRFTPTQKFLANYILSNKDEASFLTADEMAAKIKTTPSTVVRFAKEIGYSGYPELQKDLQMLVMNKISGVGQLEKAKRYKLLGRENEIINSSLLKDKENLNELIENFDIEEVKKFVEIIISSRKKCIIANRTSFSLGHFLFFELKKIISEVYLQNNFDGGIFDILSELNSEDVAIIISFPRFSKLTLNFAKYAHKRNVKILSITNNRTSPLYNLSKVCLFCPFEGVTFLHSHIAPIALINIILSKIFYQNSNSAIEKLKQDEEILLDLNEIYIKDIKSKR